MANTLYVAVYTAATSGVTWSRANLGNGRNGWQATGYVANVTDGTIRSNDGDEAGSLGAVLSAGTAYKLWAIVDDGSTSSNAGAAQVSSSFTTFGDHPSTGALSAQAATVAGAAAHKTLHTSSGALAAGSATVAGSALSPHTTTGALSAQAATVAGSAAHKTLHTSSGALVAQAATVAGAALSPHLATAALSAQAATVAGSAAHLTLHASSGALEAGAATVAGDAEHTADGAFDADGALSAQAAAVVGAAQRFALHTSSGALAAGAATVAGSATRLALHTAEGAIAAGAATVAGSAAHVLTHDATGDLEAGEAALSAAALTFEGGGASAASVWNYVLSNGLTAEETLVAILECCQTGRMARVEKLLRNKQITDPVTGKLTLFDDDDVTPLLEGNLYEDADGTQPYRGQGAERRERLV